jgi:hypothetical protein
MIISGFSTNLIVQLIVNLNALFALKHIEQFNYFSGIKVKHLSKWVTIPISIKVHLCSKYIIVSVACEY